MRTSISCQWCRKSKVKCHHNGTPPCAACAPYASRECVLSMPTINSLKRKRPLADEPATRSNNCRASTSEDLTSSRPSSPSLRAPGNGIQWPIEPTNHMAMCAKALTAMNPIDVRDACQRFFQQYSIFGFLHKPSFFEQLDRGDVHPVKLCAIIALCQKHAPCAQSLQATVGETSRQFADLARQAAMSSIDETPDIDLVQTLIILSLHYWGDCKSFRAWTLIGLSARICQTLRRYIKSAVTHKPTEGRSSDGELDDTSLAKEIACRTYWASFIMECMLNSGKNLPANHNTFDLSVPLPLSEDDFEFGATNPRIAHYLDNDQELSMEPDAPRECSQLGLENTQRILIRGFQVWAHLSSWICGGGRRTPHPSSACAPWRSESYWNRLFRSLQRWKEMLSPRILYSTKDSNLKVYLSRGQGETFAMINYLYNLSVLFIHRDYVPFLAHRVQKPCGPVDPPLISETPPQGWWENGSRDIFQAAESTIQLTQALDENPISIDSPFTCFCIYIAASMLCYLDAWPHMAPEVKNAKQHWLWAVAFLEKASPKWPICDGWRKTLLSLDALYQHINAGGVIYSHFGRDDFIHIEDRLHRFTDAKPPKADDIVASLHGSPASTRDGARADPASESDTNAHPVDTSIVERRPESESTTAYAPGTEPFPGVAWENQPDFFAWYNDSGLEFTASQDFLASILSNEQLEDWLIET